MADKGCLVSITMAIEYHTVQQPTTLNKLLSTSSSFSFSSFLFLAKLRNSRTNLRNSERPDSFIQTGLSFVALL